ncbi:restriction endonuclease [Streptomyces sp. RP5T]|uniref:restriction endonuclease n=1 Tax=Streptomyces sp. RP5T TaxID=2490848 RepID=UPI0021ADD857|nr:restriction endonuclease [Streptomyces sp. RP5T]
MGLRAVYRVHRQLVAAGPLLLAAAWFYGSALLVLPALASSASGLWSRRLGRSLPGKQAALAETYAHLRETEARCRAEAPLSRDEARRVRDLARQDGHALAAMRTWDKALLQETYARTAHAAVSLEQFADDQHRQADAREREQARRQLRESLQQRAHEHRAATELAAAKEQLQRDEIRALRQDHDRALLAARDREERQAQEARLWRTGQAVEAQRQARAHPHRGASVEAGRQLEERVAQLLERDGFTSVEVTGAPGDLGADVTARTVRARRVVVQCKNYADRRVTSTELQRFGGTFRTVHAADIGLVVTTTEFTRAAMAYARQAGIRLMDGHDLRQWSGGMPLALG